MCIRDRSATTPGRELEAADVALDVRAVRRAWRAEENYHLSTALFHCLVSVWDTYSGHGSSDGCDICSSEGTDCSDCRSDDTGKSSEDPVDDADESGDESLCLC